MVSSDEFYEPICFSAQIILVTLRCLPQHALFYVLSIWKVEVTPIYIFCRVQSIIIFLARTYTQLIMGIAISNLCAFITTIAKKDTVM